MRVELRRSLSCGRAIGRIRAGIRAQRSERNQDSAAPIGKCTLGLRSSTVVAETYNGATGDTDLPVMALSLTSSASHTNGCATGWRLAIYLSNPNRLRGRGRQ